MFINEFDVFVGKHQTIPSLDQSTEQLHLMVECFLLVKAESVRFVAAEGLDQLDCFWMEDSERGDCYRPEADPLPPQLCSHCFLLPLVSEFYWMICFLLPEVTTHLGNTCEINRDWSSCIKKGDVNIGRTPTVVEEEGYFSGWSQASLLTQTEYLLTADIVSQNSETAMRAMKEVVAVLIKFVEASWAFGILGK